MVTHIEARIKLGTQQLFKADNKSEAFGEVGGAVGFRLSNELGDLPIELMAGTLFERSLSVFRITSSEQILADCSLIPLFRLLIDPKNALESDCFFKSKLKGLIESHGLKTVDFSSKSSPAEGEGGILVIYGHASDLKSVSLDGWRPQLIICISCGSVNQIFPRFVKGRCSTFLGCLGKVDDKKMNRFGELFFGHFLQGQPIHESVQKAKEELKKEEEETCLTGCTSLAIVGNPFVRLPERQETRQHHL